VPDDLAHASRRPLALTPIARGARGAVVAPHHLATAAGLQALAAGGSAVDAAIATNAVLAVVAPNGCGIGGDAFWLVWDASTRRIQGLNGSGRAPAAISAQALRDTGLMELPRRGPLSITIPGAVRSWGDAHTRWGRLTRPALLDDAIELAEAGFPAWDGFIGAVEATAPAVDRALGTSDSGFRRVYRPADRPWRRGELVRLPALGGTLRRLADEGFDAFYDGDLGERQAAALQAVGGVHAASDFADHRSDWTEPIAVTYRGRAVATHPPNSGGVTGLEILRLLERFEPPPPESFGRRAWADPQWVHLGIEAAKVALVDRDREVGDPDVAPVDLERVIGADHVAAAAAAIDPTRARTDLPDVRTLVSGTIYLATADAAGNVVSLIQSHASGFGSGIVDPDTGIHYQSRGASFSLEPGHRNELGPRRRTLHSLVPAMTFRDGTIDGGDGPWVVHGSMGGDSQPMILAQVVSALVDGRADVAAAVGAPRWTVGPAGGTGPPMIVGVEADEATGYDPVLMAELAAMGHDLVGLDRLAGGIGHCHAIELADGGPAAGGSLAAATDPRSAGLPATR
jgi:gamma-glutamyltranspeptidase/glutathione hydrolase